MILPFKLTRLSDVKQTPENTASRILTENRDKIFEQVTIPGSNKLHFKLAFEPGNFDEAVELYYEWTRQLIENDWPRFFGPKGQIVQVLPMDKGIIENPSGLVDVVKREGRPSSENSSASANGLVTVPKQEPHSSKIPIKLEDLPIITTHKLTLEELYDDWDTPIPGSLEEVVQVRESTVGFFISLCYMSALSNSGKNRFLELEEVSLLSVTSPDIPT